MMTLNEIKKAVDHLSPEDRRRLRDYLEERAQLKAGTMNFEVLMQGVEAIRAGLSEAELQALIDIMNMETIKPVDDTLWNA